MNSKSGFLRVTMFIGGYTFNIMHIFCVVVHSKYVRDVIEKLMKPHEMLFWNEKFGDYNKGSYE